LQRYQEKRYRLFGKPTGVIAVSDKSKVECLIMCALRLALMNNTRIKRNRRRGSSNSSISMSAAIIANDDNILNSNMEDNSDDCL
jgi:hypothetical protein